MTTTNKIDPKVEIRRLDLAIQQKREELQKMEDLVIRATEPEEVDPETRKLIDKLKRELDIYSNVLTQFGLQRLPRPKVTTEYLKSLLEASQEIKAKRDSYAEMIPLAENKLGEYKKQVQEQRKKLIDNYSEQLQKLKKIKDMFNSIKDLIHPFVPNYIIPLKNIANQWRNNNTIDQMLNSMNNRIQAVNKNLNDKKNRMEAEIQKIEDEIKEQKKRRHRNQRNYNNAKQAYDDSIAKKKQDDEKCRELRGHLRNIQTKQNSCIDNAKKNISLREKFCAEKMLLLNAQMKQLDALIQKVKLIHGDFSSKSTKLSAESSSAHGSYTIKFKSMRKYAKLRKEVLQTIPKEEFRLFLLNESDLYKWYKICKANYEKSQSNMEREIKSSEESLDAAKVRYNMALRKSKNASHS